MNAPLTNEQIALLRSDNVTYPGSPVQGTGAVTPARRPGLVRLVQDAARYVIEFPRRQAVLDELSRLSDRELADIGLQRSELRQVFARARA
jgi:uncharacterized protein YjiS (DUF1127 family)